MLGGGAGWIWWLGKPATLREASPRWVGGPGPTQEDGTWVRWLSTDRAAGTEVRRGRGGFQEGASFGDVDKMNGR
jgi:hypothetical protein